MNITGIIPARYGSTRFPGKPLADIHGTSMIMRVYARAKQCSMLRNVIVATDDSRIYDHVLSHGGAAMMTSAQHHTGTQRCHEVATTLPADNDAIINIQGDEPYIMPEQIAMVCKIMMRPNVDIGTLIKSISNEAEITNPNVVKCVVGENGDAMYFSRCAIPYHRDSDTQAMYYKHIGIYGYRTEVLHHIVSLPPSAAELAESLEQLRWLHHGYRVSTDITPHETISVDTPADLALILTNPVH